METISHYYAAAFFDPKVDCILDIGGQDMKCIKIKDGTVDSVTAQRGLFLRLRLLHRDLRQVLKLQLWSDFAKEAPVRRKSRPTWVPDAPCS